MSYCFLHGKPPQSSFTPPPKTSYADACFMTCADPDFSARLSVLMKWSKLSGSLFEKKMRQVWKPFMHALCISPYMPHAPTMTMLSLISSGKQYMYSDRRMVFINPECASKRMYWLTLQSESKIISVISLALSL